MSDMSQADYVWTPERLVRYPLITELDLSADGEWILYALREPVLTEEESRFVTHLYRVSVQDGEPLRLTYGRYNNSSPRWSPDGRYIAFLSDRGGEEKDLFVMRAAGGEAWRLTASEKGIRSFAWSPDGTHLAVTMVPPDTEEAKAQKKAKDDVIHWGVDHERAWLWVLPFVEGGDELPELAPLTGDDRHVVSVDWADDGRRIAFVSQPTPVEDDWPETRLAVVEAVSEHGGAVESPEVRELAHVGAWGPEPKAHGEWVACVSGVGHDLWTVNSRVVLYPLGGGEARPLAVTPDARPYIVGWSDDGTRVYVLEASGTASAVYALPVAGDEPLTVIGGAGYVSAVRTNGRDRFAFVRQEPDRPNHICAMWAALGADEQSEPVGVAAAWREVVDPMPADWPVDALPETEVIRWTAEDGTALEIEALLTRPLHREPGPPYPTVVMVHGGPMSTFSQTDVAGPAHYSTAAFAERGYAVLRVNPRGSTGYGPDFRRANKRDWGGGDYRDIMAGVDLLIERGIADPDRLGIMGWSYGGYMTSWTITQTDRFRAASVGAGVTNLMSMTGTCDIPSFLPDYMEAECWDDLEVYRQHSAMFQIQGVTTPTLIQHGEEDVRVPLGQGKELYNALKRQGVEVEMYIYPRQPHGPNEPRLLMDIMRRNLEWFDRWLGRENR